jgi:AraC family transcriptional regulator, transcriptional activator of pobA
VTPTLQFEPREFPLEVKRWGLAAANIGPHAHDFYELLLVESGNGTHRHQGQSYPVRVGQVLLMAPGDLHDASGLSTVEGWLAVFQPVVLDGGAVPVELQVHE